MATAKPLADLKKRRRNEDLNFLMKIYQILSNEGHLQTSKLAKNMVAIMTGRTDESFRSFCQVEKLKPAILKQTLDSVLDEMSWDTELFEKLLNSYPGRMIAQKAANASNTDY